MHRYLTTTALATILALGGSGLADADTLARPGQGASGAATARPSGDSQHAPSDASGNAGQAVDGMPLSRVSDLVGTTVVGINGKDVGEVQNLLVDTAGQVRGAILEWGGFLGLGERTAVVPIGKIQLSPGENSQARLDMTKEQLENLPSYGKAKLGEIARDQGWGEGLRLFR